ncbi:major facilitator superfamily protein [Lophiostoma macrostomum CBS 122681]|uniref:Major facilitator superfamily protein n=1 Tax=Lophiostoma macrostomum CBS 122681 TaxID=1314788 RepID=A0A6A6TDL1_9PLEO|nr:major facilitator superfamily protein [Lophiostoma macrostomum CBS 122681]
MQSSEVSNASEKPAENLAPPGPVPPAVETELPQGLKLATILACLFATFFIVALDRTIVGIAIPAITNDFHSIDDIGWYGSAFLLPGCSFMLLYGKLYQVYPVKPIYLSCIFLFEVGSAVCGSAPNSAALIVGRAIAGLGQAGLLPGTVMILIHTIPLAKRPLYQGVLGAAFGLASVAAPLLGGAFTDRVSWRWCFYINLPFGGVVIVALYFLLHIPPITRYKDLTFREQFVRLDPIGTVLFVSGVVCLLLALQWGGVEHPWSSGQVIACLTLASVLLVAFMVLQPFLEPAKATIPLRVINQRSIAGAIWFSFCLGSSMTVVSYYVAIWFQAIKGLSAVDAGIRMLAIILPLVFGSIGGGIVTNRIGYYTPTIIASSIFIAIGTALLTIWKVDSSAGEWIGFQVIAGLGIGMGTQQPNLCMQTVLSRQDVGVGTSLVFFAQTLGGSVFLSVAQNVFASAFSKDLANIQGIDPAALISAGATALRGLVEPGQLGAVLNAYNSSLVNSFIVAAAVGGASLIGALTIEWRSIKKGEGQGEKKEAEAEKVEGKAAE